MKNIKKLLSIVMVLAMVLALGVNAFAATVTIDPKLKDHTFTAYQIFIGTQAADQDNELASVQWGDGIDAEAFVKALKEIDAVKFAACDEKDANTVAKAISENSDLAKEIAEAAADCIKGDGQAFSGSTELANGYYLIKDTTAGLTDGAYNDVVLQVTEDIEIQYKTDVPSSEKKVQDINDSAASSTEDDNKNPTDWQDSADYDIGDKVPFQITGTLPSNYGDYDEYYVAFHDEQSDGLTFDPTSVKVYVEAADGTRTEITASAKVQWNLADGCTFHVAIDDVKVAAPSAKAGDKIVVEYSSTLNANAVIGKPGNPNTSHMEFSNNAHGEGHGNTPDDTVVVFTYELNVDKVDGDTKPLAGAGFTLLKKVATGGGEVKLGTAPNEVTYTGVVVVGEQDKMVIGLDKDGKPTEVADDIVSYTVDFKGLDDGAYILVESVVPAGYNKAPDIEFTVTATHDAEDGNGETSLSGLETNNSAIKVVGAAEGALTGHMNTQVVNNSGVELPETGGIGTTIFYVVGAILVVGAVILLVTKRRMTGAEK